jgi:flagellin-like protein
LKKHIHDLTGLSPIFSVLILIAIAVIAGTVVYMFTSGHVAALTGDDAVGQEKVAVHGFTLVVGTDGTAHILEVYAQSVCNVDVTINAIIIKDPVGNTVGAVNGLAATLDASGAISTISPPDISDLTGIYHAGNYYTAILISTKGSSFPSAPIRAS